MEDYKTEIPNMNFNDIENSTNLNDFRKNVEELNSDNESDKSRESNFLFNSFLKFNQTPDDIEDQILSKKRKREEENLMSDKKDAILYENFNKSNSPLELIKTIEIHVNLIKKK